MKRDMDLLRKVLLKVEELPVNRIWSCDGIEGYTQEQVSYHLELALDERFVVGRRATDEGENFFIERLTFAAHEFLDAARQETLWQKAKAIVLKNAGTLTVEALKITLSHLMQGAAQGKTP
jgi:Hypothetical protein (DUF2513)